MRNLSQLEIEQVSKKEPKAEKHRETTVEFLASLASVLVTGLFIITFIVQAFEIPSSSMEDTLLIGDHVFVNRIQFSPQSKWIGPIVPYRNIRRSEDCMWSNALSGLQATGFICAMGLCIVTARS